MSIRTPQYPLRKRPFQHHKGNDEMGITFDGSLNLGAVLNAFVLLIGFVVAFTRIGGRIDLLALRIEEIEKILSDSKGFDRRITTLEERVTNQSTRIDELRKTGRSHA